MREGFVDLNAPDVGDWDARAQPIQGRRSITQFIGETARCSSRLPIREAVLAGPGSINSQLDFGHLDMAILRVDPKRKDGSRFPEAVT